jgi:phosphoglycolate phosphatase-like HAD superfamily hydrolase
MPALWPLSTCTHKKPHPEPLFKACGDLATEPKRAVMVGDSRVDVESGHNAGMPSVGILGGIGDEALLRAAKPDILIERFDRLLEIL